MPLPREKLFTAIKQRRLSYSGALETHVNETFQGAPSDTLYLKVVEFYAERCPTQPFAPQVLYAR